MPGTLDTWSGSLHQTFRLLPGPSPNLRPFLEAEGLTPDEILPLLPYDRARAGDSERDAPDPRRYRDGKQVYQTAGLLYEGEDRRLRVTTLGRATLRWLDLITPKNAVILGRHAAYALSACQLKNPTGAGMRYNPVMVVFPFQFLWRAMLALDKRISSDELNRAIFKVRNEDDLEQAIRTIGESRLAGDPSPMGEEVISGSGKNDRIIPWMSIASFGWTLVNDKRSVEGGDYYEIPAGTAAIVAEAARVKHRHREFETVQEYVEHVARAAALPPDLR